MVDLGGFGGGMGKQEPWRDRKELSPGDSGGTWDGRVRHDIRDWDPFPKCKSASVPVRLWERKPVPLQP